MFRLTPLMLVAGLVGLAGAADDPAPTAPTAPTLPKLPKFKDYTTVPDTLTTKVKAADGDTITVLLPEYSLQRSRSYSRSRRPPTVKEKDVEHTLTLHADALVRWSKKPDRKDDKGKSKPYTPAEMKILQAPTGAPGYLGDKSELAAGQMVEITLLTPTKVLPENLKESDYRVKWVVIQGAPPDPKDAKSKDDKKGKKDKD